LVVYRHGPVRLLFFNEGNLGSHVLGQAQVEATLRATTEDVAGLDTRFVTLAPQGRWSHAAATWSHPVLARAGLDARTARWHAVQALRARTALRRAVAEYRPDALHLHSHSIALGLGGLMRATPSAVSVDVTIGDWTTMPAWRDGRRSTAAQLKVVEAAERRAFRTAALVLAWTGWAARAVRAAAPRAHVVEHHPGLDLDRFHPAPKSPRARARILFVGGRWEDKCGADLVAALGADLGTTVELDAVTPADVPARPGLRVHRLGPGDPELMELRQQADLLALPSGADAAPWAVLEAMACGTPILGSDVGGIPDLVGTGDDAGGVLVPYGDRPALGAAARALLGDPARLAALGAAARARAEARYDATRQTRALLELLSAMTTSPAAPAAAPVAA
jgi:glycosyltransferase involved in cell wall biosynthesis